MATSWQDVVIVALVVLGYCFFMWCDSRSE